MLMFVVFDAEPSVHVLLLVEEPSVPSHPCPTRPTMQHSPWAPQKAQGPLPPHCAQHANPTLLLVFDAGPSVHVLLLVEEPSVPSHP